MNKIILISINGIGDIETMKSINVDEKTMKEIFKTYDRLNISRKKDKDNMDYSSIFKYDYSKRSTLDINSYAKI